MNDTWQFWIDVGGTFTDCLAVGPAGERRRLKVLSSGITKGAVGPGSDAATIVDAARKIDPPGFWHGFELRWLDPQGTPHAASRVRRFEPSTGSLHLDAPLGERPPVGATYELVGRELAPILAIRHLLGLGADDPLPPVHVRLGTTRGTNALLTRTGARTAFLTTRGFADILRIGNQNRPHLFRLAIQKPEPLHAFVGEIDERLAADGTVLRAPDSGQVRRVLLAAREAGCESLAICLLHAWRSPQHELVVAELAEELGFREISRSSAVAPLIKLVARGDTTLADAYLTPVLRSYVGELQRSLDGAEPAPRDPLRLRLLTSAGGLVTADKFSGKDSILSGPAGGVVGFARAAQACGFERAIGFDMGGTSTDVSRFDGRFELEYETQKAGVRVVTPMLAIETVAAGGGSICRFDGVKLVVGPESAGADPGPACYGRGGPLAITDANLYLGRLLHEFFPFPLDRSAVEQRLADVRRALLPVKELGGGQECPAYELAEGFVRVANTKMAQAIRSISIAKGYDPRDYVLVAFGSAAGQHACAVADELGMTRVLLHPEAGLLSAFGIGQADITRHRAAGVYRPYDEEQVAALAAEFERLIGEARRELLAEGVPADRIVVERSLELRFRGLDASLTIPEPAAGTYAEAFCSLHRQRFGTLPRGRAIEIVAARVEVRGVGTLVERGASQVAADPRASFVRSVWFAGRLHDTTVVPRESLRPGDVCSGPAIVVERFNTTVIEPGWRAEMLAGGELLLQRPSRSNGESDEAGTTAGVARLQQADPVQLEIFNNLFAGIAERMGLTLRNTSSSVNVKERLDFSCALFTATGDLVVNAPHIPVHLGAMGETVRCILADNPDLQPGDVFVTNDPYRGGSHLPDVTVVTPVHDRDGRLRFFTASRAHHAEIGGILPGSMPPFSRNLAEEGVLIRNFRVVAAGESRLEELGTLLTSAPFPTRNVGDNLADIAAQIAANHHGVTDLGRLIERFGWPTVEAYMRHIQDAAERKMRQALAKLPSGSHRFVDHLDDGTPIAVTLTIRGDEAEFDFAGTGPVSPGNLNANRAIVTAAVMYCLRCLIDEEIPLNQGVLAPVRILVPAGLLHPPADDDPRRCPAVVGGNVETSQRVVDVVLGALGVAAASQGTMNNLLFGDATFGYYETICGGAGATATSDGADAVHTHMTNTRLTDPEVLEQRYPVRLWEFAIRRGSGGRGRHRGGDGVVRRIEFLRALELSLLSQRRGPYAPYGIQGGEPGQWGRAVLRHHDGRTELLPAQARRSVEPGDELTLETPGGGAAGQQVATGGDCRETHEVTPRNSVRGR